MMPKIWIAEIGEYDMRCVAFAAPSPQDALTYVRGKFPDQEWALIPPVATEYDFLGRTHRIITSGWEIRRAANGGETAGPDFYTVGEVDFAGCSGNMAGAAGIEPATS